MVQIFPYFEHIQIAWKLERMKNFGQEYDYPILSCTGTFCSYGAPEVPVNVAAAYHRPDGERSMHHELKTAEKFKLAQRVSQGCRL